MFLRCPICDKNNLLPLPGYKIQRGDKVECENNDYKHVERDGRHYLARTPENILEELTPKELLLN